MAAPMPFKGCDLCTNTGSRDYLTVFGRRSGEIRVVLDSLFTDIVSLVQRVCMKCWRKIESFYQYKLSVEANIEARRPKRAHSLTPLKTVTPKRKKPSVVEDFLSSIEKLQLKPSENQDRRGKKRLSFNTGSTSTDPYELTTSTPATSTLEGDVPTDHSYSAGSTRPKYTTPKSSVPQSTRQQILYELQADTGTLSSSKTSVLLNKDPLKLSEEDLFQAALGELKDNIPFLYAILQALVGNTGNKDATISMIYAMIANSRNRKASAIQHMLTILLIKCHADNQLLRRLNKIHITMSAERKPAIMSDLGNYCEQRVVKAVAAGKDGKLNGDNVDIFVTTNDIRMENKNKDYHFFATDWTPFRLEESDFLSNEWLASQSLEPESNLSLERFIPDITTFKSNVKYLVARELVGHMEQFKWMSLVVPQHLDHHLKDVMSRKTTSYCLPIDLKNEAKYQDCIQIMDSYERQISSWYQKAGRGDEFASVQIPVGGDQLTRVRLDGAKSLRLGCHEPEERFDNLSPVIVELFHTQMDFLEKTIKKFMKQLSGRDEGTLSHLKTYIQRTSVNGNVKSRFKAHLDFMMTCGRAYLLEAAMEYFGMDSLGSKPTKNQAPPNIERSHTNARSAAFHDTMDGFLSTVLGPLSFDEIPNEHVKVTVDGQPLDLPVNNGNITLRLEKDTTSSVVQIPVSRLENVGTVKLVLNHNVSVELSLMETDDLHNYVLNYIQYFFIMINLKDAYKEGDIFRVNNTLKMMIPFFYRHSPLSKYMAECIDYVLKTEIMLPVKQALQVRVGSFVNPKGKTGKNKPADLQKENKVKVLKDLIRGLGSNKTEHSIVTVSKAAPVIEDIVSNLDKQIGHCPVKTTHKNSSDKDDLNQLLELLHELKPFRFTSGRQLAQYKNIKASVYLELDSCKSDLHRSIMNTAMRLKRNLPSVQEEQDE